MKKKILAFGLAVTMIAGLTAFAETAKEEEIMLISESAEVVEETTGDVELISEDKEVEEIAEGAETEEIAEDAEEPAEIAEEAQNKIWMLTVTGGEEVLLAKDEEAEYQIDLSESLLYNNKGEAVAPDAFTVDSVIKVFASADAEEGIIKADAAVVMLEDCINGVDIDNYTASEEFEGLINSKGDLVITVTEETEIVPEDGTKILLTAEDLKDKKLVVIYETVALSMPGQTAPSKVIVLAEEAAEEETEEPAVEKITVTVDAEDVKEIEGKIALPVRKISEALGLNVEWDAQLQAVTVGTVPMGVNFKLGENSYNKSRMMPATLEFAPTLVVIGDMGYTYVPQGFFTDILEAEVTVAEDGTVTVVR